MEERESGKDEETTSSNNNEGELDDREIGEDEDEDEEAWGTLEELLLACAVNRHGTDSWDSIANELKKRIKHSSSQTNNNNNNNNGGDDDDEDVKEISGSGFSSHKCRKKYVHLKRRFPHDRESDEEQQQHEHQQDEGDEHLQRMMDELRKVRVEELKREVNRRDASIMSLEFKVKKLEEERENNSKVKEEQVVTTSDLRNEPEKNATKTGDKSVELDKASAADESAENRSCNESNSTNHHDNKDEFGFNLIL